MTIRELSCPGILTALALLGAGCAAPRDAASVDKDPALRKPAEPIERLIETPKRMREDYRQPREGTRQKFLWDERDAEWRIHFPANRYAHAGFVFYYPLNLKDQLKQYELVFEMKPAAMARFLWVGLVDGEDDAMRVLVEHPLAGDGEGDPNLSWGEFRIPLTVFGDQGERLPADEAELAEQGGGRAAFDWNDVREIRFVVYGGSRPNRAVAIRDLRFDRTRKPGKRE